MTLINRLIKEAKEGAAELLVPENHVGAVAQHIADLNAFGWIGHQIDRVEAERQLRAGSVKMMGVPMRVVPKQD